MEISANTVKLLQNFASINSNIVIKPGNKILTISEAKNILAEAEVPEKFDTQIGIYDLHNFLCALDLVDRPSISFEKHFMQVGGNAGRAVVDYYYADTEMLTSPQKPIEMPESDVSFTLDQSTINGLKKAAGIFSYQQIMIEPDEGIIKLSVVDPENATSNKYSILVDGVYKTDNFKFYLNITNLKLIADDYKVNISKKLISEFCSVSTKVKYWIALEKTSTFGEENGR